MRTIAFAVAVAAAAANGAVEVSPLFSSRMVLQRGESVSVFGHATPGERVTVEFAGRSVSTAADEAGRWCVDLGMMGPSLEGRTLCVSDAENRFLFDDVLVGDVWVCSGQSNMAFHLRDAKDADKWMEKAKGISAIRRVRLKSKEVPRPLEAPVISAPWAHVADDPGSCTAVGWLVAHRVFSETGVPIGLVEAYKGDTRIEKYIPPEALERAGCPKLAAKAREPGNGDLSGRRDPSGLWNAMIAPLASFPVAGILWYQGEANGAEQESYARLMESLAWSWRRAWRKQLPFCWVQLPGFEDPLRFHPKVEFRPHDSTPAGGGGYCRAREAQRIALSMIPQPRGMAVTIDCGEPFDIHPRNKAIVGERLARVVMAVAYDAKIVATGPLFRSVASTGDGAMRISFESGTVGGGLMVGRKTMCDDSPAVEAAPGTPLGGFAIAGTDKKWHWAEAAIDGNEVVVSCKEVSSPVAVRYAYRANPMGEANLYNRQGLPASPFCAVPW